MKTLDVAPEEERVVNLNGVSSSSHEPVTVKMAIKGALVNVELDTLLRFL